jgi:hypothetical protein
MMLETERLVLCPFQESDAEDAFEYLEETGAGLLGKLRQKLLSDEDEKGE